MRARGLLGCDHTGEAAVSTKTFDSIDVALYDYDDAVVAELADALA